MADIHYLMERLEAVVSAAFEGPRPEHDISKQAETGVDQVLASLVAYLDTIPDKETAIKVGNEIAAFLGAVVCVNDVFSDLDGPAGDWIERDVDDEENGIASDYDGDLPA